MKMMGISNADFVIWLLGSSDKSEFAQDLEPSCPCYHEYSEDGRRWSGLSPILILTSSMLLHIYINFIQL